MITAYNLLGYFTLIYGFMGVFAYSVPRWLGLITIVIGAFAMFMSFSRSRFRALEPLVHGILLIGVALTAIGFHARGWFPAIGLGLATVSFVVAGVALSWASHHAHGMELPPSWSRKVEAR